MKIYGVTSTFYDDFTAKSYMTEYDLPNKPENKFKEMPRYDVYVDYYTNKKDAENAVDLVRKNNSTREL